MTNEANRRSIRRLILEAIITGAITGAAEGSVIYLLDHAATITTTCTRIVHHLLG